MVTINAAHCSRPYSADLGLILSDPHNHQCVNRCTALKTIVHSDSRYRSIRLFILDYSNRFFRGKIGYSPGPAELRHTGQHCRPRMLAPTMLARVTREPTMSADKRDF